MNFKIESALKNQLKAKEASEATGQFIIYTNKESKKALKNISEELSDWQLSEIEREVKVCTAGASGPIWTVRVEEKKDNTHNGLLLESEYAQTRELVGSLISQVLNYKLKELEFDFYGLSNDQIKGAIVGLELALYRFEESKKLGKVIFKKAGKPLADKITVEAKSIATGINQARHLVNLPPNMLHPVSYAKEVQKMFKGSKTMKVTIWDEKRLAKEKCGLLLSVGKSANNKPRLIHIKYRPTGAKGKAVALVGKGLTFDSGGLDIKSAAGMRLMKKDMGGSATLVGFSRWLETSKVKKNVDIYLACAENAISENASRPSDIYTARNGMTVEIHNTDAEGRLAMADIIDVALDAKPDVLIDVATLTGAGKVALGQDIASLFSNDDKLAEKLQKSSQKMGDLVWRMPLYNPYFKGLSSEFADMANAASGHGGAITAALFLQKFVGKTKWAHLDIFGWTSSSKPSLVQKGGSGQGVEALIGYFS